MRLWLGLVRPIAYGPLFDYVGKNLLTWVSKKQPTLSRFSAEAEYKTLALTTSELLLFSYLLRDLAVPFRYQFILHCSNASLTHLAPNPVFHARSKHIEVYYHFVRRRGQIAHSTCS
jgi:hypothetical protein